MSARDPLRELLGRGVAFVAGLSDEEGHAAVDTAERVRDGVRLAGAVVDRALGARARRAPTMGARASSSARALEAEVIEAEVIEDAAAPDAVRVEVRVEAAPRALPSRYR